MDSLTLTPFTTNVAEWLVKYRGKNTHNAEQELNYLQKKLNIIKQQSFDLSLNSQWKSFSIEWSLSRPS